MTLIRYLHVLLFLPACTSPDWKAYEVDQHVTVQLPRQPVPINLAGMHFASPATQQTAASSGVRALNTSDSACTYGIIINSEALAANLSQPVVPDSFYNQGIRNVLQRQHVRLLVRSTFMTAAGPGIEVKFGPASATSSAAGQYIRTVLVGRACYTFIFHSRDKEIELNTIEQRRRFFNSIVVKP